MKKRTIQIDEQNARKIYRIASPEFKQMLEDTFGKSFFETDVLERVNDFADALTESGRPEVPEFNEVPEDLREFFKAQYRCIVIAEALNEGKRFDLFDEKVKRHYPYFTNNGSPAGFRLGDTCCDCACSYAGSGSRLCFLDEKRARFAAEKFPNEFSDMLAK